jgi:NOL1/NOP2/fmu family ribosome biogenesis protein
LREYLSRRFGLPLETLAAFRFFFAGRAYRIMPESPHLDALARLKIRMPGLKILRRMPWGLKPTGAFLTRFGALATRNLYDLTLAQTRRVLGGEDLELTTPGEDGYVILRHRGLILGCGLRTGRRLYGKIPKGLREMLKRGFGEGG